MRPLRWLAVAILFASSCGHKADTRAEPAPPLPGPIRLGEHIKTDLGRQKDEAKARRQLFDEAVESK